MVDPLQCLRRLSATYVEYAESFLIMSPISQYPHSLSPPQQDQNHASVVTFLRDSTLTCMPHTIFYCKYNLVT